MKESSGYSVTSNTVKLFKHLDTLKGIQEGRVVPIMVHVIPTHRCQLNCVHCCFKNRADKTADMPLLWFESAMDQFYKLGTRAIEFTGGGDPALWPYINEVMEYLPTSMHVGIITNGLGGKLIEDWKKFDWVRVSLNTLDYQDDLDLSYLKDCRVSFCYIWNDFSPENIWRVVEFANKKKVVCRLAPDCIVPKRHIVAQLEIMRLTLKEFPGNEYVFLSDFNVDLERKNNRCRIHMIKPCLYLDGYLYACPSAELALENNKQIQSKVRICRYDDVLSYYQSLASLEAKEYDCSYCKYVQQQEILEAVCMETEFNEFA